jgi:hypothetical protein
MHAGATNETTTGDPGIAFTIPSSVPLSSAT